MRRTLLLLILALSSSCAMLTDRGHQPPPPSEAPAPPKTAPEHLPTLRMSPRVGIAPLELTITGRLAKPLEGDQFLELAVIEGDTVIRRSQRDINVVQWAAASTNSEPWMYVAVSTTHRATWTLGPGTFAVVACVYPGGRCVADVLEVR